MLKENHMPFATGAMQRIAELVNADQYQRYGKDLVMVASTALRCDQTICTPFEKSVNELFGDRFAVSTVRIVAKSLIDKVLHAVCKEVIDSFEQVQVRASGAKTTKGQNLRDKLHIDNA